ncbi:MAG: glutathione S-transferase family protein [Betaproteobacteria bacterium]|nr:glutathione S-transferase family protein [Betaproteobacteria bacterium]
MKLIIGNKNYSSWSLRAWLALRALNQPFEEERILLDQPGTREQILRFSPSGRVPCLIDHESGASPALHGGVSETNVTGAEGAPDSWRRSPKLQLGAIHGPLTVWDSLAIIEYIAERFPQLWPAAAAERAVARAICAEMHSGFQALRSQMPMNIRRDLAGRGRSPESEADIARIVQIWSDCRRRFGHGGPYLFGNFSAADAMYAPVCFRFQTYAVEPQAEAGAYLATMLAHPAMQEWAAAARAETEIVMPDELP